MSRKVKHNLYRAVHLAMSSEPTNHELGCDLLAGYLEANKKNPDVYSLIFRLYEMLCERTKD